MGLPKVFIVGTPNVGKSMLFNRLTGQYATVSNYPGTTVELYRGRSRLDGGERFEIIDTPGLYSLWPITDDERVACEVLFQESAQVVLHVIDAKNIQRMLGLTLQLIEAELPLILVLNMADEARALGIRIDCARLEAILGIRVIETVATRGEGIVALGEAIAAASLREPKAAARTINYGAEIEAALTQMLGVLNAPGGVAGDRAEPAQSAVAPPPMSPRARAIFLLQREPAHWARLEATQPELAAQLQPIVDGCHQRLHEGLYLQAALAIRTEVDRLIAGPVHFPVRGAAGFRERLGRLCMHPVYGLPILAAVLFFGLYEFVGVFGAGTIVNWLEGTVFEKIVNPWIAAAAEHWLPWPTLRDLFAGDYGILTLGVRYAVAIILPVVGTFFIAFSILEDSGYLPRMAMLIDRLFKKIGLNGRAVIPIVLGFGCDTMAQIVTRTLETRRELIIATILLALAIPCSAQLGVIFALLAGHPAGLAFWIVFVSGTFLVAGWLAARLMPGEKPSFYMELPPLRWPRPANVLLKTYTRVVWYFKEVFPLFVLASLFIWIGQITGGFQWLVQRIEPAMGWLGLPKQAAVAFLFGFFRRDYGAAGLYDLRDQGLLTGNQLVVAAITLTLFLPCVAQFLVVQKERGWRWAAGLSLGILVTALAVGVATNATFRLLGVAL